MAKKKISKYMDDISEVLGKDVYERNGFYIVDDIPFSNIWRVFDYEGKRFELQESLGKSRFLSHLTSSINNEPEPDYLGIEWSEKRRQHFTDDKVIEYSEYYYVKESISFETSFGTFKAYRGTRVILLYSVDGFEVGAVVVPKKMPPLVFCPSNEILAPINYNKPAKKVKFSKYLAKSGRWKRQKNLVLGGMIDSLEAHCLSGITSEITTVNNSALYLAEVLSEKREMLSLPHLVVDKMPIQDFVAEHLQDMSIKKADIAAKNIVDGCKKIGRGVPAKAIEYLAAMTPTIEVMPESDKKFIISTFDSMYNVMRGRYIIIQEKSGVNSIKTTNEGDIEIARRIAKKMARMNIVGDHLKRIGLNKVASVINEHIASRNTNAYSDRAYPTLELNGVVMRVDFISGIVNVDEAASTNKIMSKWIIDGMNFRITKRVKKRHKTFERLLAPGYNGSTIISAVYRIAYSIMLGIPVDIPVVVTNTFQERIITKLLSSQVFNISGAEFFNEPPRHRELGDKDFLVGFEDDIERMGGHKNRILYVSNEADALIVPKYESSSSSDYQYMSKGLPRSSMSKETVEWFGKGIKFIAEDYVSIEHAREELSNKRQMDMLIRRTTEKWV